MTGDGGAVDQGQAVQLAPTDVELERAITSVPGVVSAGIDRSDATGRSRMRLRLAPGEDEEAVAWAVAATLRERFGIALDPDAIRSRPAVSADPADDPVRVVEAPGTPDGGPRNGTANDHAPSVHDHAPSDRPRRQVDASRSRLAGELAETRERLRRAAAQALDGVAGGTDVAHPADAAEFTDLTELLEHDGHDGAIDIGSIATDPDPIATDPDPVDAAPVDAEPATPEFGSAAAPVDNGQHASPERQGRTVIPRAAIRDLQVHRDARSVQVTVVLAHGERSEEGRAVSVPTSHGTLRAVAEATVAALRALTEGAMLVGIERVSAKHGEDAPIATVVLSLLTRRGEERLLGASIIRDGPERAVLRATLDALNRRVTPLLVQRDAVAEVPG